MPKKILVLGLAVIFLSPSMLSVFLQSSNQPKSNQFNLGHLTLIAALVDSLSPEGTNQQFDEMVVNILEETGFVIDHYSGSNAVANFSGRLFEKAYNIIILRTHTTQGIPASQNFHNTVIIAMGCSGFTLPLAEDLVKRGVGTYVAWRGYVRLSRTDRAVVYLLENLFIKTQTIEQAVSEAMEKMGPDPIYNSTLNYYPFEAGNYTIWDIINGQNTGR